MTNRAIELWNAHDTVPMYCGAQSLTNIVGRLSGATLPEELSYSINGSRPRPVYVKRRADVAPRLISIGDFNVDTLTRDMLQSSNSMIFMARYADNTTLEHRVNFPVKDTLESRHSLKQRMANADFPEQVAQVVDGGWTVAVDESGKKVLELDAQRAGYDRIILLTERDLGSDYTVTARLCVTSWQRALHHVGLLFQWNPHPQGGGTGLPEQWSTGLAHYHAGGKGLRFRVGVDVHFDENGNKVGGQNFALAHLSPWRAHYNRVVNKLGFETFALPQLPCNKLYDFELRVRSRHHSFTAWPTGTRKPNAQIVIPDLPELLPGQAAGVIAHYGAVRIYDFEARAS